MSQDSDYWAPAAVYVCDDPKTGCEPTKTGELNIYYKGTFSIEEERMPIKPGGGGNFDGGGASIRYEVSSIASGLGLFLIIAVLLSFIRKLKGQK